MLAKLRRQLEGPSESGSSLEPLGNQPNNSGDYSGGLDARPRTGSSGSKFPRSKPSEGITNEGITDSTNRMRTNQSDLRHTPSKDRTGNGTAQLPAETSGPDLIAGKDKITLGSERRENQASSGVKKKNVDDIEILTAKYARSDSGYGSTGNMALNFNRSEHAQGIDRDSGEKFRAFSEKGSTDSFNIEDKSKTGFASRDAKSFHDDVLRNESMGSRHSITEGNRSPVKGTSGVVQNPVPISNQPGAAGQVSGKYATMPRMHGQAQPPVNSVGNSPVHPGGPNISKVPEGVYSSNTIPRTKFNQPPSHMSRVEQLKPIPGVQNVPSTGLTGPLSSTGTTITASNIANSGITVANSTTPPAAHRPQQSNHYTLNHHQPGMDQTGIGDQQRAPRQAYKSQQPQSLPYEQNRPDNSDDAAKEQRTDKESNASEVSK